MSNKKNKLLPKLRFPEFQNSGEWEVKRLGEVLEKSNEKVSKKEIIYYTAVAVGELGLRDRNEIYKSNTHLSNSIENYKKFPFSSICFGLGSKTLAVDVNDIKESNFAVSPAYKIFKFDFNLISPTYLKYFINYIKHYWSDKLLIQSSRQGKSIDEEILFKLTIPLPPLPEQQKIAACLSSLYALITAERQKLQALKDHKKGLLQNLFPQEGETLPKLRFPEFQNSGEWEVKRLEEIADFLKGKGISKADVVDNGKLPCIRYGELYTHYGEVIKEIKSFTNMNAEDLMLSEPNDVIIPSSGETKEDIATASCVKVGGVALGGDLNILRSSLNGDFLAYYLCHGLKKAISKIAQGDAVVHLYTKQLKKLIIRVTLNKKEQQKIADCLSSLDELIQAQTQRIELLELHKKGLLQGLFPTINESDNG